MLGSSTRALDQFLTYEYVLAPRTILKGVHKLPPAHYPSYRDGQVTCTAIGMPRRVPDRWSEDGQPQALRAALRSGRPVR